MSVIDQNKFPDVANKVNTSIPPSYYSQPIPLLTPPVKKPKGNDLFRRQCINFKNIFDKKDAIVKFTEIWDSYGFNELPYFGVGPDGARNWYNFFLSEITERNELIYLLQHNPQFRPDSVKVEDLLDWGTEQVPYGLPKNMKH